MRHRAAGRSVDPAGPRPAVLETGQALLVWNIGEIRVLSKRHFIEHSNSRSEANDAERHQILLDQK